jgi:serine/threonine protein kinase
VRLLACVPVTSAVLRTFCHSSDDLVNVILTASPRLDLKGKDGMTPYQVALHYKFKGIPRQLKKAEDLFNWLEKNDLAEFKGIFLKNEIYKNLLADISESLLDKMGVEDGPSRKKILEACRRLEREEAEPDVLAEDDNPGMDETKTAQLKQDLAALSPESQSSDGSGNQDWMLDGKELEYLKRLGSGTSGDVYKGLYRGKHCAIKVLKEMTEDKEREEFKKEFHIMSAVHHPNIVRFFGASFKPKLCMVLEFCARGSLYHVLKDETNTINWERGLQIMKETVAGIDALHGNEPMIMHRDLKSLNLLVTDDWHIKVADFGLSRFDTAEALETLKQMRGTFAYCAPESYHGEKYSPKSDIYSMGIIFWELANRVIKCKYEQPYSEFKNIQFDFQIIIQAAKSDLRPTIPTTCPPLIADVIRVCTHKERDQRPDCKALLAMIENCEKDYHGNSGKWEGSIVGTK